MMVDAQRQRHGYGARAIELLVAETREQRLHIGAIVLSHLPFDGNAGPFYERLGFFYTGETVDSELVMRLEL
ncbi:MAG TPA: GNAT family N-acetyltransferase [Dehalococcoidia bacterium]|jgi:diamine N-acetyltransferase|nr:GNAT family N-acetyltransferase [Dehalococcoidia bacterium]